MLAFARWFFAVVGGLLLGAGITLYGQAAFGRHVKKEVENTFFLWRAIGEATFAFQGSDTQMALVMTYVPDEALAETDRGAWVIMIVGGIVALTGPLLGRGRQVGAGRTASRGKAR